MRESPHQVVMDEGDQFFMGIQEVGEGPQGRLEREALGLPFEIGEAQRVGAGPHRRGRRRCASKNCRWATDIAWLRSLSRLPSSTHAATVSRQAMGMYTVRVVCASFQVNRAVGCSGPVVAHRQVGRPHRFVVTVSEPSTKGFRVRRRARIRRPAGLVSEARPIGRIVCILSNTRSTKISTGSGSDCGGVPTRLPAISAAFPRRPLLNSYALRHGESLRKVIVSGLRDRN